MRVSMASSQKRQLGNLSERISELATLSPTSAVPILVELVPGLTSSLSATGERLVHHEAYQGSGNLNYLSRIWMRTGSQCMKQNAPLRLRLQQNELFSHFEKLYESSQSEIQSSRVAWFFAGFREFSIACAHCMRHPWACIPQGRRVDDALYVDEPEYKRIWGKEKSMSSITTYVGSGPSKERKCWQKATRKQLEEAIARGID